MDTTRKLRRELGYELAKLSSLQESVDAMQDDASAKGLATEIREQAETCLHLLDQYQSSVPSRMWSDAEIRCQPLRDDLKRIGIRFRAASGEWELRTAESPWGRSWWNPATPALPHGAVMDGDTSAEGQWALADAEEGIAEPVISPAQPIEVVLNDLAFDPDLNLLPDEPAQMMTLITILVGPPRDKGAEIFSATLCTPQWLATQCDGAGFVPGHGLLVVRPDDFDTVRIRHEVERFLCGISEDTWGEVVTRIKEWFPSWEFDEFAP